MILFTPQPIFTSSASFGIENVRYQIEQSTESCTDEQLDEEDISSIELSRSQAKKGQLLSEKEFFAYLNAA